MMTAEQTNEATLKQALLREQQGLLWDGKATGKETTDKAADADEELPTAVAIASSKKKKPIAAAGSTKQTALLQVVAPLTMEAGYILHVECNGSKYRITIPEGGIAEGETFVAHGELRSVPILGGWRDGLFDCCEPTEDRFCFAAWCATPCAFACLMEPIKMDCFFRRDSNISFSKVFTFMCVLGTINTFLYFLVIPPPTMAADGSWQPANNGAEPNPILVSTFYVLIGYTTVLFIAIRYFTRLKYKIPGNLVMDCLAVKFCSCCVALQVFRHMKASGNEPSYCSNTKYAPAQTKYAPTLFSKKTTDVDVEPKTAVGVELV